MLEMYEIARLRFLTSTGLLETVFITLDLKESVENFKVHRSVERSCEIIAASTFVCNETDGL